jgi:hypothetical protein
MSLFFFNSSIQQFNGSTVHQEIVINTLLYNSLYFLAEYVLDEKRYELPPMPDYKKFV